MKRTDAFGSITNKFTQGDPLTSTPATRVTSDWLNIIQEELASAVEGAGLTLDQGNVYPTNDTTQLLQAIKQLISAGWYSKITLLNNQLTAVNLTGMILDKTKNIHLEIDGLISLITDSNQIFSRVAINAQYNPKTDSFSITCSERVDESGMEFSILGTGQIQYKSPNVAGSNFQGYLRIQKLNYFAN